MKKLTSLALVLLFIWVAHRGITYWGRVTKPAGESPVQVSPDALPGLSPELAASYQAARDNVATLKTWLDEHAQSPDLRDPRKASIQLDYVLMLSADNPAEARRLFAEVKQRVSPSSPVYSRIRKLEKTFD